MFPRIDFLYMANLFGGGDRMAKDNRGKKRLDREEFGYGYDISVDDLGVIGKNDNAKKQDTGANKEKPQNKTNPATLNE